MAIWVNAPDQLERSSDNTSVPKPARRWLPFVSLLILLLLVLIWWRVFGQKMIVEHVHPFHVTQVDTAAGTMSLVHGNRRYVVRCEKHCSYFKVSRAYPMHDVGSTIEFSGAGQTLAFPILEEETTFDVTGGRG